MIRATRAAVCSLFLGLLSSIAVAETPGAAIMLPGAVVEETVAEIVKVNTALPDDNQRETRRAKLREVVNPRFNFAEMARRSLGANWDSLTEPQRADFVTVFSDLLARTYLSRVEMVGEGMVKIENQRVEPPRAVVRTRVTHNDSTFPIDYRMQLEGDRWRVYDVVIENIGLVSNYRNEFAGILRREQFDGLMQRLREKRGSE